MTTAVRLFCCALTCFSAGPRTLPGFGLSGDVPPSNPLRARFQCSDGVTVVSMGVRRAADLRPTFLQVEQVSDWGPKENVASLLVPPKAMLTAPPVEKTLRSAETGDSDSAIARTYYLYQFTLPHARRGALSAAVRRGYVFVALATTASEGGDFDDMALTSLVDTLRV